MKKARIKYTTDFNKQEGYLIEILTPKGWGMDSFYPLVRRENANADEEANFVHFGILNKLEELRILGYSIVMK